MEREDNSIRRMEIIIKSTGMTVSEFSRYLGYKRSETVRQVLYGHNNFSRDMTTRINKAFPQFTKAWIMFGEEDTVGRFEA